MLRLALFGGVDGSLMEPVIMVRELCVGFGRYAFAGGSGVMRQRQIFLVQLLRVATSFTSGPLDS